MSGASSVRCLLLAYAALSALLFLLTALPGNPGFSSGWGLVASVLIQSLLIWRLWLGSAIAWWFGLFLSIWPLVAVTLMGMGLGLTLVLIRLVFVAQAGVLLAPPLRGFVRSHRQTPPAAA